MRVREGVREGEGVGRGVNEARGARATYLLRRETLHSFQSTPSR